MGRFILISMLFISGCGTHTPDTAKTHVQPDLSIEVTKLKSQLVMAENSLVESKSNLLALQKELSSVRSDAENARQKRQLRLSRASECRKLFSEQAIGIADAIKRSKTGESKESKMSDALAAKQLISRINPYIKEGVDSDLAKAIDDAKMAWKARTDGYLMLLALTDSSPANEIEKKTSKMLELDAQFERSFTRVSEVYNKIVQECE